MIFAQPPDFMVGEYYLTNNTTPSISGLGTHTFNEDVVTIELDNCTGIRSFTASVYPGFSTSNFREVSIELSNNEIDILEFESGIICVSEPILIGSAGSMNTVWSASQGDDVLTINYLENSSGVCSSPAVLGTFTLSKVATGQVGVADINFEQELINLGLDNILDGQIDPSMVDQITSLDLSNKGIASLSGIEAFSALINLDISLNNSLSRYDLSSLTNLTSLNSSGNGALRSIALPPSLIDIDLSENKVRIDLLDYPNLSRAILPGTLMRNYVETGLNLVELDISDTDITDLNVSRSSSLVQLSLNACDDLVYIDIRNGNNTNIQAFSATSNPQLQCIEVSNASYMQTNFANNLDAGQSFVTNCNLPNRTYIRDPSFEQALINLGLDNTIDGYVNNSNIANVEVLDVSFNNIHFLKGLENFTALDFSKRDKILLNM